MVVTLKADYVATLSAGEHTISIVSTSGTATTTYTVNAKAAVDNDTESPQTGDTDTQAPQTGDTDTQAPQTGDADTQAPQTGDTDTQAPQTGDNSHMALWIALLAASVFGLAGTAVYSKKKQDNIA